MQWGERFSILRLYIAVLFFGLVLSSFTEAASQKFQQHRLLEIGLWLLVLGWSYVASRRGERPAAMGKLYWIGLSTFSAAALIGGFRGATPWISLAFTGSALVQFSLVPWLVPQWQRYGEDAVRMLALLATCLVGMDVGLWIITHLNGFPPYHFIATQQANGEPQGLGIPYLTINSRWANQISVLLLFSYVPLMHQLYRGVIAGNQGFWQVVTWSTPTICWSQILLTQGDGGFIAGLAGTTWLIWNAASKRNANVKFWRRSVTASVVGLGVGIALSAWLDSAGALGSAAQRNVAELDATGGVRLSHWIFYLSQSLQSPLWGHGIYTVPPGSGICTPHNLWISLAYWTGGTGIAGAIGIAASFRTIKTNQKQGTAIPEDPDYKTLTPTLAGLFIYQLVDDIWLRAGSLALMLLLLGEIYSSDHRQSHRERANTRNTARTMALAGLLMIAISIHQPHGVGVGNRLLIPEQPTTTNLAREDNICLLFL